MDRRPSILSALAADFNHKPLIAYQHQLWKQLMLDGQCVKCKRSAGTTLDHCQSAGTTFCNRIARQPVQIEDINSMAAPVVSTTKDFTNISPPLARPDSQTCPSKSDRAICSGMHQVGSSRFVCRHWQCYAAIRRCDAILNLFQGRHMSWKMKIPLKPASQPAISSKTRLQQPHFRNGLRHFRGSRVCHKD